MYWPSQPKTSMVPDEGSEDIPKREPRFVVRKATAKSKVSKRGKEEARLSLPLPQVPILNRALRKSQGSVTSNTQDADLMAKSTVEKSRFARSSDAERSTKSVTNEGSQPPMETKHNIFVHEAGNLACPNDVCLLAHNHETKTDSLSGALTPTMRSSLLNELKGARKACPVASGSKDKPGTKSKSGSQTSANAPGESAKSERGSRKSSRGVAEEDPTGKRSVNDNVKGSKSSAERLLGKPSNRESAPSKKASSGSSARDQTNYAAGASVAPPTKPKRNILAKVFGKSTIPVDKPLAKIANGGRKNKKSKAKASDNDHGKPSDKVGSDTGEKRRQSDSKHSGKAIDSTEQDNKASGRTSDKAPNKNYDCKPQDKSDFKPKDNLEKDKGSGITHKNGGTVKNNGDGNQLVSTSADVAKSGSLASRTSTGQDSSKGATKNITTTGPCTYTRVFVITLLLLAGVAVVVSAIFPEAVRKVLALVFRTDTHMSARSPDHPILDAPYLARGIATGKGNVVKLLSGTSNDGQKTAPVSPRLGAAGARFRPVVGRA